MTLLREIPVNWEVKKVEDILILKGGSTPSTSNDKYWNGMIPWVVPTDVTKLQSKFIENTERNITKEGLLNCSATLLPIGSILLTSRATIGYLAINKVEMATNQGFINILPSKEIFNIYLYYFLDYIKTKFVLQASGSTFLELSKNSFRKFCIPFPPLPEQHRIAEILSIVDETIERTEALIEKYRNIQKGLMADLLTRGIDEEGRIRSEETHRFKDSPLGRVPEEWGAQFLGKCCKKITDGSHFSPHPTKDGPKIANVKDIIGNSINIKSCTSISSTDFIKLEKGGCSPNQGDVLLSKDGTIGKTLVYDKDEKIVLLSSIAIIKPNDNLSSYFLHNILKSFYFDKQMLVLISGSALKRIVLRDINLIQIPLPPLPEQHRIAEILTTADERIEKEEVYKNKLLQIKKGLMQDLLTGRVRVKVPQEAEA